MLSTCESCIAIIVGSTPAFAAFFKGQMPGALWQASMSSFVRKFTHGASTSNTELSHAAPKRVSPARRFTVPGGHTRHIGYPGPRDTRHFGDSDLDLMRTDIQEEGVAPRILEECVILKPVATHQSKREEQSDVEGWDNESFGTYTE